MVAIELVDFEKLGKALESAAKTISSFADSVAHMIKLGLKGYDEISARKTLKKLKKLRINVVEFSGAQEDDLIRFEDYMRWLKSSRFDPDFKNEKWSDMVAMFRDRLIKVQSLLENIRSEKSDFVLENAYQEMRTSIGLRFSLFKDLTDRTAPHTFDELEMLEKAGRHWRSLALALRAASDALAKYVKDIKRPAISKE